MTKSTVDNSEELQAKEQELTNRITELEAELKKSKKGKDAKVEDKKVEDSPFKQ